MAAPLPPGDGYVVVSQSARRPMDDVWPIALRETLPTVAVPLSGTDPDARLDLQAIFTLVYERAGYDYSLDYTRAPEPPLSAEDAAWAREVLSAAS